MQKICLANRSRLIYESFSDSSRDVDLVSQEILLSDLRFVDCAANKRSNVFTQILRPMEERERNNPLQAEVHFRYGLELGRDFNGFEVSPVILVI